MLWLMMALVFAAGCLGGVIPLLTGRKKFGGRGLVYKRKACNTWFPGMLGHVLVGGTAAVVFWGLYSPFSQVSVIGAASVANVQPTLTLAQLTACIIIGIGGPDWLLAQAERKCSARLSKNDRC